MKFSTAFSPLVGRYMKTIWASCWRRHGTPPYLLCWHMSFIERNYSLRFEQCTIFESGSLFIFFLEETVNQIVFLINNCSYMLLFFVLFCFFLYNKTEVANDVTHCSCHKSFGVSLFRPHQYFCFNGVLINKITILTPNLHTSHWEIPYILKW